MANSPKKIGQQPAFVETRPHLVEPTPAAPVDFVAASERALEPVTSPIAVETEVAKTMEAPLASLKDMQEKARGLVEKSLVESRANFTKAKSAANEATSAIEASYGAAKDGVVAFNVKAIEAFKSSAEANFDFIKSLATAKSLSEYVTLQTEFSRKQFETGYAQAKELATLARKVADEAVAPIKAQVSKAFKVAV